MEKESQTIFEKNVIEFVTVAAEFCAFLERAEHMKRKAFVDTSLKILPLLCLLWGQKLVNTLRALHDVKYNQQNENDEEDNEEENNELSDDDYCCEEDGCHCHDDECHCHEDGCHCRNDE